MYAVKAELVAAGRGGREGIWAQRGPNEDTGPGRMSGAAMWDLKNIYTCNEFDSDSSERTVAHDNNGG
jgi:hypothetical protein